MAVVLAKKRDPEFEAYFYEETEPPIKVSATRKRPIILNLKAPQHFRSMLQVNIATGEIVIDRLRQVFERYGRL